MGAILGLSFISGILVAAAWAAVAFIVRYSSLASLVAIILAPIFLLLFAKAAFFIPAVLIAALVIWKHKENIERLKNKTESKIEW
ncbi:MAG: hypothetical protein ACD_42C00189G0004 [uncultured bacterium]|nr:MAG: hypothetical protein ACD_42C00189G0004 [uncultured bacterium]